MSVNTSELQQMIDAAKLDLIKTKSDLDAAQKANDSSAADVQVAQADRDNQFNKLEQLKLNAVQARADGKIELANQLDAQVEVETATYNQLVDIAQDKWNTSQYSVDDLLWAQEFYEASQNNLKSLQDQQNSNNDNSTSSSIDNSMSTSNIINSTTINPGDKIQVKVGAIDVTNGVVASSGQLYVQGSSLWATVESVDTQWATGSRWGLPEIVIKVRCKGADGQTIVWQVTPDDIASNIIKVDVPIQTSPTPPNPKVELTVAGQTDLNIADPGSTKDPDVQSVILYTTKSNAQSWSGGIATTNSTTGQLPSTAGVKTQVASGSSMGNGTVFTY